MRGHDDVELDALGESVMDDDDETAEEKERHILEADHRLVAFYATHIPDKLHTLPATVARLNGRAGRGGLTSNAASGVRCEPCRLQSK